MIDVLKLLLISICFWLLLKLLIPKIKKFFVKRNQNKLLISILKSDPSMKRLIEKMELKIKKKVKFGITPLSIYGNVWGADISGVITVPLDRNKAIIPHNRDQQIYSLAHELVHLQEKDFEKTEKNCGYKFILCMFEELKADLLALELLKEVGIEIGKQIFKDQKQKFWSERLKIKVDIQCEKCHQIAKEKKCPELQKIFEYLNKIALEAEIALIS